MEITGKITHIGKEEKVGANETPKLVFVVEEIDKEYPTSVALDLRKDKIDVMKNFKVGDIVKVSINSKAREYNGKYFNSLSAWKVNKVEGGSSSKTNTDIDDIFAD